VFSRDGRSFAAFDGPDGAEVAERLPGGGLALPKPRRDSRSFVRVWDVATGRERAALAVPTSGMPPLLTFSPDGRRLAVLQVPAQVLQVWDIGAPEAATVATLSGGFPFFDTRSGRIAPLEFSPDGRFLALRPAGQRGHVWDFLQPPPRPRDDLLAHDRTRLWSGGGTALVSPYPVFSPDSRWLVVPGREPGLLELRPTAGVNRSTVLRLRHTAEPARVIFSTDGRTLAVATERGDWLSDRLEGWLNEHAGFPPAPRHRFAVQLFDTATGAERAAWTVSGYFHGNLLGFAADGRSVWTEVHATDPAVERGVRAVQLWDGPTGRPPVWLVAGTVLAGLLVARFRSRSDPGLPPLRG
jgi:hypothetical protein